MKKQITCLLVASSVCFAETAVSVRYAVEVSASGQISHDGKELSSEQLKAKMHELAALNRDQQVLIVASEHAPLEAVSKVIAACKEAGIKKFILQEQVSFFFDSRSLLQHSAPVELQHSFAHDGYSRSA